MAKMRRGGAGDDGWQNTALPHTLRSMEHFNRYHWGGGSLPVEPGQVHTKLVNHGETRYGLEVLDSTDGWLEWSLHRQHGPDIDDPDHWERMGVPAEVHPYCSCIGNGTMDDGEHDLNFPLGGEDGFAGYTNGGPDVNEGIERAKADAEEAFQNQVVGKAGGRGLGDYDINDIMRGEGM
jgi:hypothetical protein